jgi:hypothetical protein
MAHATLDGRDDKKPEARMMDKVERRVGSYQE